MNQEITYGGRVMSNHQEHFQAFLTYAFIPLLLIGMVGIIIIAFMLGWDMFKDRCPKHRGIPEAQVPPCRACQRAREANENRQQHADREPSQMARHMPTRTPTHTDRRPTTQKEKTMHKTEFTKGELEELLANEPDTKLKKKLLAMMEPGHDELTEFHNFMQSVRDNLTATFGKRRIVIPADKKDRYGYEHWNTIKSGKCTLTIDMHLDYIEQALIRINDGRKEGYSAAEIRIRRDNPKKAAELAKMVVDYLNGDSQ